MWLTGWLNLLCSVTLSGTFCVGPDELGTVVTDPFSTIWHNPTEPEFPLRHRLCEGLCKEFSEGLAHSLVFPLPFPPLWLIISVFPHSWRVTQRSCLSATPQTLQRERACHTMPSCICALVGLSSSCSCFSKSWAIALWTNSYCSWDVTGEESRTVQRFDHTDCLNSADTPICIAFWSDFGSLSISQADKYPVVCLDKWVCVCVCWQSLPSALLPA